MVDPLANVMGLYAGLLLLNTLISALMWWTHRGPMYRDLVWMWGAMVVAFLVQGATSVNFEGNHLVIVLGFSSLWFANLAFAQLVSRLLGQPLPLARFAGLLAAGLALGLVAWLTGQGFAVVAMPVALGVAFPTLSTATGALWAHWSALTITGRGMMFSCLAIALHQLDYPFLRMLPEFTVPGFTVALVLVFALSIFAPAVILEVVTREQATVAAEMDVARQIQLRVLPGPTELADVPDLEIQGYMRPADEVGGDYYDVCQLGGTSWILVGDVTGHGLSSGLVMLMAQSVIASILHTRGDQIGPAELNYLANRVLFRNLVRLGDLRTMTIVALRKEPGSQRYVYSGNHEHVYIYRAEQDQVERLEVAQVPHDLGFLDEFPQAEYREQSFELGPQDLLLMATDGVTEAARRGVYADGMFDTQRVAALLTSMGRRPLGDIRDRLLGELEAFTGGVYHDDVTFLLARPVG